MLAAGRRCADDGQYGAATSRAVAEFQDARGLHRSGICDEATWLALVEASWSLGDRWLKLASPYMRGDDVDQLQTALLRLGFNCGRPDGIFGPLTDTAVKRFQRHCGVRADGLCGPDTVRILTMNSRQSGDGPGVAMLRDLAAHAAASIDDVRIVVGQFGGLSSLARQIARALRQHEASVLSIDEPDPSAQADVANHFGATAYVGFEASTNEQFTIAYFAGPSYESVGGRVLAERIADGINAHAQLGAWCCRVQGMRLPILRETKMPAVACAVWPVSDVVSAAPLLTDVVVDAVLRWAVTPLPV